MVTATEPTADGTLSDWPVGSTAHFEYHCNRAHDSADAQLWYRSHRTVEIMGVDGEGGGDTIDERLEAGDPRSYHIRFADGHVGGAFEDELLVDPSHFRSDMGPPSEEEIAAAGCAVVITSDCAVAV